MRFPFAIQYFLLTVMSFSAVGQKPALDTGVLYHWPSVENGILSNDGSYAGYVINGGEAGFDNNKTLVLKGVFTSWEIQLPGVNKAVFTADSRRALYIREDTLHILSLGTLSEESLPNISQYQLFQSGQEEDLLYYAKTEKQLTIRGAGNHNNYRGVDGWLLSEDGGILLKKTSQDKDNQTISRIDLVNKQELTIWNGDPVSDWVMDKSGEQVAFSVKDKDGNNHIWYYKKGYNKAMETVNDQSKGIDRGLKVGKLLGFSKDDKGIFFNLKKQLFQADPNMVSVDIWSYRDPNLQSEQLQEMENKKKYGNNEDNYLSVVRLEKNNAVLQLQQEGDIRPIGIYDGDHLIFGRLNGSTHEGFWSVEAETFCAIVDTRTGERKVIKIGRSLYRVELSPTQRFLLYHTPKTYDIVTYELATGITRSITSKLPLAIDKAELDVGEKRNMHFNYVIGWLADDKKVIVGDAYDIWELDPGGQQPAINLTNQYGMRNKTAFELAIRHVNNEITEDTLLLSALNKDTKDNGYYRIILHKTQDPEKLTMGPYVYSSPFLYGNLGGPAALVKARNAQVYLLTRESVSESPNYFVTKDFKSFQQLSDVYPERNYNWMRSKLFSFKTTDGRKELGVLYIPGNFDPNKKYPLIFQYYNRRSDELNRYQSAEGPNGELNVPWFTSHGYMVFIPDIHYILGKPGERVLQSVLGATNLLKTLPYVDSKHMGLQGHSYGGWETNYLVTHTHEFVAALSSCGVSDLMSSGISKERSSDILSIDYVQYAMYRMGTTLWEHPDYYIYNSPIFYADKVTTPLLMMGNKVDNNVPFTQDLEFFTALRRLGKKVWMLQYDKGTHGVYGKERLDYILRSTQFFDHYLKGAPAPKWMVEGIPALKKGIDDGMELEPAGVEPGPGLLTPEAQKQIDALKNKKPITITFKGSQK